MDNLFFFFFLYFVLVAPVIPDVPRVIRIEKKKTIVVECHVKAQSEPSVLWYKEQSVVQKSSKHMVHVTRVSEVCVGKRPAMKWIMLAHDARYLKS